MHKKASVQDSLNLIEEMLNPVRARVQKTAAEALNEDGGRKADTSSSFKDSSGNTIEAHEKKDAVNSQTNLGREQSGDAKDVGGTAVDEEDNKNELGTSFADTQGPNTLGTDDPVKTNGNIGPMAKQEITQEQKIARANHLGNAILDVIAHSFNKTAAQQEVPVPEGYQAADYQANVQEGIEDGGDLSQKTAADEFFDKLAHTSAVAAQEYYEGHLLGLLKRAEDEYEILRSDIPAAVLQKVGGVEGLLDKVAEEFPEAVMPEEAMEEGGGMDYAGDEAGAEAAMLDAGMAAGGEDADLEALVGQLEAAGVTPEELEQAFADVEALQEAGIAPEELAQALTEVNDEEGGALGDELAAAPAPEGLPIDEGEAMKEAAYNARVERRQRIDDIKTYLTGR